MIEKKCRREICRVLYEVIFMLKELKKERNIALCRLAEMTGLAETTIKRYDKGRTVTDKTRNRIEIVLDVIEKNDIKFPEFYQYTGMLGFAAREKANRLIGFCRVEAHKHPDWQ